MCDFVKASSGLIKVAETGGDGLKVHGFMISLRGKETQAHVKLLVRLT